MSTSAKWCLGLVLLLAVIAAIYLLAIRDGHEWSDDFGMYVLNARNLAEGRAYTDTPYIYNPNYPSLGPPAYPPICPMLLAPIYHFLGPNLEAMKLEMAVALVFALLCLALGVAKKLSWHHVLGLVAIVGLNGFFLISVNGIGSDLPFLAFTFLALWLLDRAYATSASGNPLSRYLIPASLAMYLAYGTRTVGIVMLPTLVALDLVRYRRPTRQGLLAVGIFLGLAIVQGLLFRADRAYGDQLAFDPRILAENAFQYLARFAAFWNNGYAKMPAVVLFAIFTAIAVAGYASSVRERIGVYEIFPVLYLGIIFLFPSYQGERFLFPVLPLYVYYGLRGLELPWLHRSPLLARVVPLAIFTAVAATYCARYRSLDFGPIPDGPHKAESVEMFRYIAAHTGDDDVIVFVKPRAMALYASRRSSVYHQAAEDAELWDYMRDIGATYIVSVENDEILGYAEEPELVVYLRQFIRRNGDQLDEVFANADFRVYRVTDAARPKQQPKPILTTSADRPLRAARALRGKV